MDEETDFLRIAKPEELKVIDPACGSGHMLTYAFDLLYAIYEEEGYAPSAIPGLILANNLHGTEIDPRAGALAAFALTMKAAAKRKLFLKTPVEPNVCVIDPISFSPDELDYLVTKDGDRDAEEAFWNQFAEADTFGALIAPDPLLVNRLARHLETLDDGGDIYRADAIEWAKRALVQARYLLPRYSVVVANPPYMGSSNMSAALSTFVKDLYPLGKSDLFSAFMLRGFGLLAPRGYSAMVVMQSWMFLAAYEKFRHEIFRSRHIECLAHLGNGVMGIAFGTSAVVFQADKSTDTRGAYLKYSTEDIVNGVPRPLPSEAAPNRRASRDFSQVPGYPLVYFATDDELSVLAKGPRVGDLLETREGLTTGDNDAFLRRWFEVSARTVGWREAPGSDIKRSARWFLYVKGGEVRRWYGNMEYVVDWEADGLRQRANIDPATGRIRSHNYNGEFAFRRGLTWTGLSNSSFSVRYVPEGNMFDAKGPMGFAVSERDLLFVIALLNSSTVARLMAMLAPTMDFKLGHVLKLPVRRDESLEQELAGLASECIEAAREGWDEAETAYGFTSLGVVTGQTVAGWWRRSPTARGEATRANASF